MLQPTTAPSELEVMVLKSLAEEIGFTEPTPTNDKLIQFITETSLNEALSTLELRGLIIVDKGSVELELQLTEFGQFLVNLL